MGYKIVLLGASGMGAAALGHAMTPDHPPDDDVAVAAGIEFDTRTLDTERAGQVALHIWDAAVDPRSARLLLPWYLRGARGALLLYDVADASSFERLRESWTAQLDLHRTNDLAKLLVGVEQSGDAPREVSTAEAEQFCANHSGLERTEVRAGSGEDLVMVLETLVGLIQDGASGAGSKNTGRAKMREDDNNDSYFVACGCWRLCT